MIFIWQSLFCFVVLKNIFIFAETSIFVNVQIFEMNIPKQPTFHWLPKHLNHITENIVFNNRNVSFLAINRLFRQTETHIIRPSRLGNNHFEVEDFIPLLPNDRLRTRAEN
jgi:hypothetical protein